MSHSELPNVADATPPAATEASHPVSDQPITIAMVAGEASGDILGAGLIASLKKRYPKARFEGIGGPLMEAEGFKTHVPMERLSVMGLVEVLGRIFELIGIRWRLKRYLLRKRPAAFIGIDAPDFNLGLELALRRNGIKTGHYVSPSVWAWRQNRVFKIARAVDLMLTLFPFEAQFYRQHRIAVRFVGHPLADGIPLQTDRHEARQNLGLAGDTPLIALLPGSRGGEIAYIGRSLIEAALWLRERRPDLRFVIPCVNEARKQQVAELLKEHAPDLSITLVLGRSREVMQASDVVVLASGTATLEGMLMKRPMVVAYRVSQITYRIMRRLLKAPFVALPNLLAGREVVPELLQDDAQPEKIGQAVLERLSPEASMAIQQTFSDLHQALKRNASEEAADAVVALIEGHLEKPDGVKHG
ncbi:MAG: lipid-A-disaccharide synthase [Oleiphilaceae bacterium]|nr:lipid-A-disaccharide synthase [Oleiphilaceae bacterium]